MIAFCQTIGMVGWRIEGLRPESQKRKLRDELKVPFAKCGLYVLLKKSQYFLYTITKVK